MSGLTKVVYPSDSLSELSGPHSRSITGAGGLGSQVTTTSGGAMPSAPLETPQGAAEVSASPQGKGVGVFALGTSPGENGIPMEEQIKDPKVEIKCTPHQYFCHTIISLLSAPICGPHI